MPAIAQPTSPLDGDPEQFEEKEEAEKIRGIVFKEAFILALEPASRMSALARHVMKNEMSPKEMEARFSLVANEDPYVRDCIRHIGVVEPNSNFIALYPRPHLDYKRDRVDRGESFHPRVVYVRMKRRPELKSFYMSPRPGAPHQYEMLMLTNYEGIYNDHFIYYLVDLGEVTRRALQSCPLSANENFYIISRSGHAVVQGIDPETAPPSRHTRAEELSEATYRKRFTEDLFGYDQYAGFSRGGVDFAVTRYAWEQIYSGFNDAWTLVFEERFPIERVRKAPLRGTWRSLDPSTPLRLGILQEESQPNLALVRGASGLGSFTFAGAFIENSLGLTRLVDASSQAGKVLVNARVEYDDGGYDDWVASQLPETSEGQDTDFQPPEIKERLTAYLQWMVNGEAITQTVPMARITKVDELSPLKTPLPPLRK